MVSVVTPVLLGPLSSEGSHPSESYPAGQLQPLSPEPTTAALALVGAERCDLLHGQWTAVFFWSLPNPCQPPGGWQLSSGMCQDREDTVQVLGRP